MPEELRFLLRSALYSVVIGVVYWFVSYEWAGTVLLVGAASRPASCVVVVGTVARTRSAPERPAVELAAARAVHPARRHERRERDGCRATRPRR